MRDYSKISTALDAYKACLDDFIGDLQNYNFFRTGLLGTFYRFFHNTKLTNNRVIVSNSVLIELKGLLLSAHRTEDDRHATAIGLLHTFLDLLAGKIDANRKKTETIGADARLGLDELADTAGNLDELLTSYHEKLNGIQKRLNSDGGFKAKATHEIRQLFKRNK